MSRLEIDSRDSPGKFAGNLVQRLNTRTHDPYLASQLVNSSAFQFPFTPLFRFSGWNSVSCGENAGCGGSSPRFFFSLNLFLEFSIEFSIEKTHLLKIQQKPCYSLAARAS